MLFRSDVHSAGTVTTDAADVYKVIMTPQFPDKMTPIATGTVLITVKGRIRRTGNTADIIAKDGVYIRVRNLTGVTTTIIDEAFDLAPWVDDEISPPPNLNDPGYRNQSENTLDTWVELTAEYTLPAAGPRQFELAFRHVDFKGSGAAGATGTVTITRPSFIVRPLPSGSDVA